MNEKLLKPLIPVIFLVISNLLIYYVLFFHSDQFISRLFTCFALVILGFSFRVIFYKKEKTNLISYLYYFSMLVMISILIFLTFYDVLVAKTAMKQFLIIAIPLFLTMGFLVKSVIKNFISE